MGIVAVKNLLEEGFDVVGFERSNYIGGLWHFTEDEDTLSIIECEWRWSCPRHASHICACIDLLSCYDT